MNVLLPLLMGTLCLPNALAQTNSDATMQALLTEVRQLRLALEKSVAIGPRIQMTLQRMQLQQEVVSRASRQLDEIRTRLSISGMEAEHLATELKVSEARLNQEQDPVRRKSLEEEIRLLKTRVEQVTARNHQSQSELRANEIDLSSRLRSEQAKLDQFAERLDSLERSLEMAPKQP